MLKVSVEGRCFVALLTEVFEVVLVQKVVVEEVVRS